MESRRNPRLELIAVDDGAEPVRRPRLVGRKQAEVGRPATFLPALGVAGAHEEPVRPGLEAGRVAELRKVLPDAQQRLLRRILGEVEVAQDPARHGKVPIGDLGRKEGVRLLVTSLSSITRSVSMPLPHDGIGSDRCFIRYGQGGPMRTSIFAPDTATPAEPSATPASFRQATGLRFDLDGVDDRLELGLVLRATCLRSHGLDHDADAIDIEDPEVPSLDGPWA